MRAWSVAGHWLARAGTVLLGISMGSCAVRGHLATPEDVARLQQSPGLSASGRMVLSGAHGRFSARLVFGVARPDFLRIEIPAGTGLRFLMIARNGALRAELPEHDAMFQGPGTREVMDGLFGIDIEPKDLVAAILGSPQESLKAGWRFEGARPVQVTIHGSGDIKLVLTLDDAEIEPLAARAFEFGPPRTHSWSLREMSNQLGLRR